MISIHSDFILPRLHKKVKLQIGFSALFFYLWIRIYYIAGCVTISTNEGG